MDKADVNHAAHVPVVAIVGRSNIGKSTLFNRLIRRRQAIVASEAGVTRDYNEGIVDLWGDKICFIDTGGIEERATHRFSQRLKDSLTQLLPKIDLILFCIDGREGVTHEDLFVARWLRRQKKPCFLVANKVEGEQARFQAYSAFELGMGDPYMISAEHGEGIVALCETIKAYFSEHPPTSREAKTSWDDEQEAIKVVVAGRPNTGKSTLLNTLVGESRLMTGDEAGVTRDSITIETRFEGQNYRFVDTAGLRKKSRINEFVEKRSVGATLYAIRMAEIVILVIDAAAGLTEQDLQVARLVEEEGRGCLLVLNKWDKVRNPQYCQEEILNRLYMSFAQMRGMPVMLMSALQKKSVLKIYPQLKHIDKAWNTRIPTSALNRWFEQARSITRPPLVHGHLIKLRYITQVKTRPPTFSLFGTRLEKLPRSYVRYLVNSLKEAFDLYATPIRMLTRTRKNPFDKKKYASSRR